ncbi:MAG: helix-turn-helix domain-containing protein [Bryobacteraceae bacterium]
MESDRLLLSPREAAKLLAVSPRKLWAMTFEEVPGLPYVRCGRLVRYRPEALQAWIAAHEWPAQKPDGIRGVPHDCPK